VIRVVVADDETLFRSGLAMIVEAQSDLEMVARAKDGHEAVEAVRRHRPDVILMDIQMPVLDGIKATKEIVRLGLPTRVLS
jgi:YesN/AraC family two-component response regulator